MKSRYGWIAGAALALALGGQGAYYHAQRPAVNVDASWFNHPKSLAEAKSKSSAIVLAQVVSAQRGADLVTVAKGEPNDEDRIPTQQITVRVLKGYKGAKAG